MPRRAPLVLDRFLPYRLNVLAALTSEGLAGRYARHGVSIPEWRILATLGEFGRATAAFVGAHSHMHKTKVSRAAADLVARGLVRREANAEDLREGFLTLTAEGRRVHVSIAKLALAYQASLVDGMDEAERDAMARLIDRLTERSRALLENKKSLPALRGGTRP